MTKKKDTARNGRATPPQTAGDVEHGPPLSFPDRPVVPRADAHFDDPEAARALSAIEALEQKQIEAMQVLAAALKKRQPIAIAFGKYYVAGWGAPNGPKCDTLEDALLSLRSLLK